MIDKFIFFAARLGHYLQDAATSPSHINNIHAVGTALNDVTENLDREYKIWEQLQVPRMSKEKVGEIEIPAPTSINEIPFHEIDENNAWKDYAEILNQKKETAENIATNAAELFPEIYVSEGMMQAGAKVLNDNMLTHISNDKISEMIFVAMKTKQTTEILTKIALAHGWHEPKPPLN